MRGPKWVLAALLCAVVVVATSGCSGERNTPDTAATNVVVPTAPLPEGLAFIQDGAAFVVRSGKPVKVLPGDTQQSAVVYDAEGDGLVVTENSQISGRTVRLVKGTDTQTLLQTDDGSNFGEVRFASARGQGFYIINGQPGASFHQFYAASGTQAARTQRIKLPKNAAAGFDIAADGTTMVYATDTGKPADVVVMDGARLRFSVGQLSFAYTASFSRDGKKACLTGIKSGNGPITVWTLDLESQKLAEVPGAAQYRPTHAVFSPDRSRIAFRNADDGSVWIVPAAGGTAEKLPLTVDDTGLDW